MKKILCMFLSVVMIISTLMIGSFNAFASTYTGTCGENSVWTLNTSTGTLTVSGSGEMYDDQQIPAFQNSTVKKIVIGDRITHIGSQSFSYYGNVTSVTIGKSVKTIGGAAFSYCVSLTEINIPGNVESIDYQAFENCKNLRKAVLNEGIKSIGNNVFNNCVNLNVINLPISLDTIYSTAFLNTGYYNNNQNWDNNAFYVDNCLIDVKYDYDDNNLYDIEVRNNTGMIGMAFFCNKTIRSIILPESVKKISSAGIYGCENLKSVKICNPNCILNSDSIEHSENITIIGYPNSTAKRYTDNYGINFKCIAHDFKSFITKATISKNGKIQSKCSACGVIKSTTTIYYPKTIKLSSTIYTYNGKVKKPTVAIKDSKGKKISSSNYTVKYASGRKNVGQYSVKIIFKGNYSGSKTLYFTIRPRAPSISSLTKPKSKAFLCKWKKVSNISGYEVQYSESSSFKKNVKKKTTNNTYAAVQNLKKNKKYYIRVRTYKTVKVNGKSTKFYSSWSKTKSIKTK